MRSTLKSNIAAVLAAAGMALAAPSVLAQSNVQGAIVGTVAPGSGAEIVIVSKDTGWSRTITPDSEGRFAATALPTGKYSVTLKQSGQSDQNVDVTVTVGSNTMVRFDEMLMSEVVVTGERSRAAIDTSSVEANMQITAEELRELPVARTETAVALLAPGTTLGDYRFNSTNGASSSNLASFSGSSVAENGYFVNGFNVTNFRNGVGGSTIPFEAYQDFQVKTGGYSAEFGRSTGGVINTTTKRGTNEWKFGVNVVSTFADLEGSQKDVIYFDEDTQQDAVFQAFKRDEGQLTTASAEIGGPLWKDHLFFYGIYQFRDEDTTNWTTSQRLEDTADDPFWLAKIDFKITDNHLIEGTYWSDQNDVTEKVYNNADTVTGETGDFVGTTTYENGGENYVFKYTGYWTDTFTASALYGHGEVARSTVGAGDACPAVYDGRSGTLEVLGCWTSLQPGTSDDARDAWRVDFEWRLGDHALRFGYDNEENTSEDLLFYSGHEYWRYYLTTPGAVLGGGTVPAGVTEVVRKRIYENGGSFDVKTEAYYLEDTWQVTDEVLLSLGIRNESFENFNANGDPFIKVDDQWAPRLGFAWDVKGDGSSKLYGNAGRYYLPVASNTNARLAGAELFTEEWFPFGGIDPATGVPTGLGAQIGETSVYSDGSIKDPLTVRDDDIGPQYQDEYILGYQWQYNDLWSFGIKGVYRDLKQAIEDISIDYALYDFALANGYPTDDFDPTQVQYYLLANPGNDVNFLYDFDHDGTYEQVSLTKEELGYPDAERTYTAIELTAQRAFADDWYLMASYVWSESEGNIEGYVKSDNGQDDAGLTQDFDHPALMEGTNGPLPNNREHTFKLYGLYQLTPEWRFSTNMYAQSGRPKSCFGLHPTSVNAQRYGADSMYCGGVLNQRGSQGETPWIYNLDLGVEYVPSFFDGNLSVKLDVFNAFNLQEALLENEYGEDDSGDVDYSYGAIQRYQRPRSVRLGVSYNFGM
jgi:hypothetical protein